MTTHTYTVQISQRSLQYSPIDLIASYSPQQLPIGVSSVQPSLTPEIRPEGLSTFHLRHPNTSSPSLTSSTPSQASSEHSEVAGAGIGDSRRIATHQGQQQRGTVRRRPFSPSPDNEDGGSTPRPPKQRQRTQTSELTSPSSSRPFIHSATTSHSTTTSQPLPTTIPTALSTSSTPQQVMSNTTMGHPMPSSSNGSPSSSTSLGPTNGHRSHHITPVHLEGSLMYEDDKDWVETQAEIQALRDTEEDAGIKGKGKLVWQDLRLFKKMPVDREEIVRLVLQGLRDIGYNQSADTLEAESGYTLSTPSASAFQAAILGGRWSEALALLPELGIDMEDPPTPSESELTSHSSSTIPSVKSKTVADPMPSVAHRAKFYVAQQKYLEYLEVGQQKKALHTLRAELAPLAKDSDALHTLSGLMMCADKDDLYERAGWDGASGTSRRQLLECFESFISPQLMLPQRRLAGLLDQARRYQALSCNYHSESEPPTSLYMNHMCQPGQFPSVTTHILADHTDEVWRIEWSPDGNYLASAGKEGIVVIWKLEPIDHEDGGQTQYNVKPIHQLSEHRDAVEALAWSPDGKTLVIGADKSIYLWDTETGKQKSMTMSGSQHHDTISAIQWRSDGTEFLVSSMDRQLIFYSPSGSVLRQWTFSNLQVADFVIHPDNTRIIAVTTSLKRVPIENKLKPSMSVRAAEARLGGSNPIPGDIGDDVSAGVAGFGYGTMEHGIMVIRLADREIIDWSQDLRCQISSIKISSDAKRLIVSCQPDEIQMWSLDPHLRFLRKFTGHIHQQYLIRSGFGALKDRFILSGSEDHHVYVWQTNSPNPIEVLGGHTDSVNAVAWNPVASRRIFASCSDDTTVRIWQTPTGVFERRTEEDGEAEMTGRGGGLIL